MHKKKNHGEIDLGCFLRCSRQEQKMLNYSGIIEKYRGIRFEKTNLQKYVVDEIKGETRRQLRFLCLEDNKDSGKSREIG